MLVLVVAGESIVSMATYLAEGDYRVVHALQVGGEGGGGGERLFFYLSPLFCLSVCALRVGGGAFIVFSLYLCFSLCVCACFDSLMPAIRESSFSRAYSSTCAKFVRSTCCKVLRTCFCGMCGWDILSTYGMSFVSTAVAALQYRKTAGPVALRASGHRLRLRVCASLGMSSVREEVVKRSCTARALGCARVWTQRNGCCVCIRALSRLWFVLSPEGCGTAV